MGRVRRGRKDGNHSAIVDTFRSLGCSVAELTDTGLPGWPDTVVGCVGVNHLVEIKNRSTSYGKRGMNENQTAFSSSWRGERVWVVSSVDEVVAIVNNWRRC